MILASENGAARLSVSGRTGGSRRSQMEYGDVADTSLTHVFAKDRHFALARIDALDDAGVVGCP